MPTKQAENIVIYCLQCRRCGETDLKKLTITEDAILCDTCLKLTEDKMKQAGEFVKRFAGFIQKQSVQGTAVHPILFPTWLDGSSIIDPKYDVPRDIIKQIKDAQK